MRRLATLVLLLLAAGTDTRAADVYLESGVWVSIKGAFSGAVFEAHEVELLDDDSRSIKGKLDGFSADTGELRFGSWTLPLDSRSRLEDAEGNVVSADSLAAGVRLKVSLSDQEDGTLRVRRVRLLTPSSSPRLRLEGPIEAILPRSGIATFLVLGVEVRTLPQTTWNGIVRSREEVDDDDVRPAGGMRFGRWGRVSGEFRLDYIAEDNFDLFDDFDGDIESGRARTRIEWVHSPTPRIDLMLQVKGEDEEELTDEADEFDPESKLTLGRAYVLFNGVVGPHGSIQVGRSRFDDARDWLYNRDVDAVRLFFDFKRWHLEGSLSEELVDPTRRHEDTLNTHLLVEFYPARRHTLAVYLLDRDDSASRDNGLPRDFSPRLTGFRATGRKKHAWSYWLEAVTSRGSNGGTRLRGEALDGGFTLVAPWRWEPSITVGYAFGSGDPDTGDDVDETFRQSGLQLNNGKWNGVASFRYYGELMRPELANLHVETYGVGIRPARKTSLDLVYHRYELDEPASEMVDSDVDGRTLNLVDTEIGEEWDLIFGFEQLKHFEFELNLGWFEPGKAFLGPTDAAIMGRFKVKYVF
jgi:alginate production protein